MKRKIFGVSAFLFLFLGLLGMVLFSESPSVAQVKDKTSTTVDDRIKRPTSNPFRGDLSRYDRENRAEKLQIQRVMNLLQITKGNTVADIGAGGGWFSEIASNKVGENGKIYAVDINEDAIKFINDRKLEKNLKNIMAVLGKTDDPFLPANSIDAVLILNTYHEIAQPIIYMKNLKKSLKKNALVGIIDRDGDGDDHGIKIETIVKETKQAGYSLKAQYDFVEDSMDYFLIFELTKKTNITDRKNS